MAVRDRQVAAAGGLLFVVLSVVSGATLPKPPNPAASSTTIAKYLVNHHHRIELASAGAAIAALGLLVLVVYLHERLAPEPIAARLVLASGSVLIAVAILGALVQGKIAQVSDRLSGDTLVLAFAVEQAVFYIAPALAVIGLMAGVARGGARAGLPSWLGGYGLLIAGIGVVAGIGQLVTTSTGFAALGFVGFLLTVLWVALMSVTLLRESTPATATARANR